MQDSSTDTLTTTFEYAYNAVENRTTQTATITSTVVTAYQYDAANRLTNVNDQEYTWDDNGNLVSDGAKTYTYNQANRLTAVDDQSAVITFAYNGDDARLRQVIADVPTTYTQDFAAPLPVVLQAKTGLATTQYLYALSTHPLAQNGGAWEYLLPDALGSVRQIADTDGNVTLAKSYEPYGSVLNSSGSGTSVYGFSGEERDTSGLIYLRARYLQPRLGIFLARDPWSGDVLRPGSMNGWGYVENRPTAFTDPSGREPELPGVEDGTYEYSCMCGWIDWNHASSAGGVVYPIRDAQLAEGSIFGYKTVYINQHEGSMGETGGVYGSISVSRGLGKNTRQMFEVSLGVWESLNNLFEGFQRGDQFPVRRFADTIRHSGFSEEDTTSDLLAFYRTVWEGSGLTSDQSKQRVRELCLVVGMFDEPSARIQKQKDIFDKYVNPYFGIGGFKDNSEWGNPRLVNIDTDGNGVFGCRTNYCTGKSRQFPQDFKRYNAWPPQVGGLWSWNSARAEIHWHFGPINYNDYYEYNTQDLNK